MAQVIHADPSYVVVASFAFTFDGVIAPARRQLLIHALGVVARARGMIKL